MFAARNDVVYADVDDNGYEYLVLSIYQPLCHIHIYIYIYKNSFNPYNNHI